MLKDALDIESCDCNVIHEEVVAAVRKKMPDDEVLLDLADLFKVFGDSTRVKIICALLRAEMCVCDIAVLLGMSKSAISHQLRTLRQTRLVKYRREGKVIYYSLEDEHVGNIFDQGLVHVSE
ncbi:MAG: metalloregulator ArsR/SmtB family transcription factor [Spirochaetaceae bacterium]|jgi:DNA-binding transcriptional ArsR family regulator|nr:metalloregulator ArsR/SmtB family transcription factor [Spirochaetaceae bacterium]